MLKHSHKVFLVFKLPDETIHSGFFLQKQRLGDIVSTLCPGGKTKLDQGKTIGELDLKNDDVIEVRRANPKIRSFRK